MSERCIECLGIALISRTASSTHDEVITKNRNAGGASTYINSRFDPLRAASPSLFGARASHECSVCRGQKVCPEIALPIHRSPSPLRSCGRRSPLPLDWAWPCCHFHYSKQTVQVRRLPQRKPPPYGDASGVKEALLEIRFCSIYRRSVCREELPECTGNIWQSARGRIMRRTAALPKRNSFLASFISSDRNESWHVLLLANRKR